MNHSESDEAVSQALRNMFFSSLRSKLYDYLRMNYLKNSGPMEIWKFCDEIITEKMDDINNYLNNYMITIKNYDVGVNQVMVEILIPYIENLRVK